MRLLLDMYGVAILVVLVYSMYMSLVGSSIMARACFHDHYHIHEGGASAILSVYIHLHMDSVESCCNRPGLPTLGGAIQTPHQPPLTSVEENS